MKKRLIVAVILVLILAAVIRFRTGPSGPSAPLPISAAGTGESRVPGFMGIKDIQIDLRSAYTVMG